jgi:hypothetical protein
LPPISLPNGRTYIALLYSIIYPDPEKYGAPAHCGVEIGSFSGENILFGWSKLWLWSESESLIKGTMPYQLLNNFHW